MQKGKKREKALASAEMRGLEAAKLVWQLPLHEIFRSPNFKNLMWALVLLDNDFLHRLIWRILKGKLTVSSSWLQRVVVVNSDAKNVNLRLDLQQNGPAPKEENS